MKRFLLAAAILGCAVGCGESSRRTLGSLTYAEASELIESDSRELDRLYKHKDVLTRESDREELAGVTARIEAIRLHIATVRKIRDAAWAKEAALLSEPLREGK